MTNENYFIYSPLTEEVGHLILDDFFWFKNLLIKNYNVSILTSKESTINISSQLPNISKSLFFFKDCKWLKRINYRLFLIYRIFKSKKIKNSTLIIQGFEEISILLYLIRIKNCRNKVILIHTNNISPERLIRSKWFLKYILNKIFKRCDIIVYHSDYVFNKMKLIINNQNEYNKLVRIKYHLLGNNYSDFCDDRQHNYISFFGPTMLSKPVHDICSLIRCDKNKYFNYRFLNVNDDDEMTINKLVNNLSNVSFVKKYFSHQEYLNLIKKSTYVFLPHNFFYEGKLSGIFSDCVALGIPVISNNIDPVNNYFEEYGQMGFIFDYSKDIYWQEKFLSNCNNVESYKVFLDSMKNCRNQHNESLIINEFLRKTSNL